MVKVEWNGINNDYYFYIVSSLKPLWDAERKKFNYGQYNEKGVLCRQWELFTKFPIYNEGDYIRFTEMVENVKCSYKRMISECRVAKAEKDFNV